MLVVAQLRASMAMSCLRLDAAYDGEGAAAIHSDARDALGARLGARSSSLEQSHLAPCIRPTPVPPVPV
jgi:hypothetical protein